MGQPDETLLGAARAERLTLVTYDVRAIPRLLSEMAADHEDHSGVLFVEDATLHSSDLDGLVNALLWHWERYKSDEWMNRVAFLKST